MTAALDYVTATGRVLRDYQAEAIGVAWEHWGAGQTRIAEVLATGLGKTDIIAAVATRAVGQLGDGLILAHREELLDQITARIGMHDPTIPVGRVQGGRHVARRPITVGMSSTVKGEKRRHRMRKPRWVIVDECHHAVSPSYMAILRWAGVFDEDSPTPLLGLTATFTRGDTRGLADVFEAVPFTRDIAFGIDEGYLVRPHGRVVVGEHVNLDGAKVRGGDYQDAELGEMVAQDVEQIVAAWLEHAVDEDHPRGRQTVAFTPNVASAAALAAAFRAAGVPAGEVYGNTNSTERRRTYGDLERGALRVLVSVMVPTEGWDCPPVSCVLQARPTKLPGLYQQMVGRGLRLSPETGKADCLVLDVVGSSRTLRLQTLVDLVPSATYDRLEVDLTPCESCGGFVGRRPGVARAALDAGMEPCCCPCPGCGGWCSFGQPPAGWDGPARFSCDDRGPGDPDGGRRKLTGPARYAFVDLLGDVEREDQESLNWLATEGGVPFLACADRYAAVARVVRDGQPTTMWSAAHVPQYGSRKGTLIAEYVSFEHAKALVEKWARAYAVEQGTPLYARSQPWRVERAAATEGQVRQARKLGIPGPENFTKGGISDRIDIVRASRQLDR